MPGTPDTLFTDEDNAAAGRAFSAALRAAQARGGTPIPVAPTLANAPPRTCCNCGDTAVPAIDGETLWCTNCGMEDLPPVR